MSHLKLLARKGKSAARRVQHVLPGWMLYSGPRSSFAREFDAVSSGLRSHAGADREAGARHAFRRRVHMLEKGLSMRPRRVTFAESYIGETVNRLASGLSSGALTQEDKAWAIDVMCAYFEATVESGSDAIQRARAKFDTLGVRDSGANGLGPAPRGTRPSPVDIVQLRALAEARQSVRWFRQEALSRADIDRALDVAMQSPTACNRLPYKFLIFDDQDEASEVAKLAGGTAGFADNIPALAVVVGDLSAYSEERDRHLIYIDGSLASMSFVLGLEAVGLSSCCINWPDVPHRERAIAQRLNLSRHERVIMLIAIGYADSSGYVPGSGKVALSDYRTYVRLNQIEQKAT